MNRNCLREIIKGLLKCAGIAAGLAVLFILGCVAAFFALGLLLSPLLQQMPYLTCTL